MVFTVTIAIRASIDVPFTQIQQTRLTFLRFFPAAPIVIVARPWCSEHTVAELATRRGCRGNSNFDNPVRTKKPILDEVRSNRPTAMKATCTRVHLMFALSPTHRCSLFETFFGRTEEGGGGYMISSPGAQCGTPPPLLFGFSFSVVPCETVYSRSIRPFLLFSFV